MLYLKGRKVENGTPEYWIEHYAAFGIDLVYLDFVEQPMLAASKRWQNTYYSFYVWLKANDRFDVIHTSEWRGGAFYCLQAKRLGLAFRNTIFITKTSSPEIWHRYYQMQPIDDPQLLAVAYAEQKCVEWADLVVGGSAHLLSFMSHIGYRLPEGRSYVQPNIIDFSEVIVADERPDRAYGDVVRSGELVFFGRLEHRKGLEVFVGAINALVARGVMPETAGLSWQGGGGLDQSGQRQAAGLHRRQRQTLAVRRRDRHRSKSARSALLHVPTRHDRGHALADRKTRQWPSMRRWSTKYPSSPPQWAAHPKWWIQPITLHRCSRPAAGIW